MQKEINVLSGFKTYLVAAVTVLTAVLAYLNGKESLSTALTSVPGALLYLGAGLAALRSAVAKVEAKVDAVLPAPVAADVAKVVKKSGL